MNVFFQKKGFAICAFMVVNLTIIWMYVFDNELSAENAMSSRDTKLRNKRALSDIKEVFRGLYLNFESDSKTKT